MRLNDADSVYVGSNRADKVYLGLNQVYPPLPTGPAVTRTNLAANPSFEVNTTGWFIGTGTVITRVTTQSPPFGTACLQWKNNVASITGPWTGISPQLLIVAGTTLTYSVYVKAATVARTVNLYLDSYGGPDYTLWQGGFTTASTTPEVVGQWTRMSWTFTTLPNSHYHDLYMGWAGTARNELHFIDGVLLEETDTLKPYFDGSTTNTGTKTYAWTGTAHQSPSTEVSTG